MEIITLCDNEYQVEIFNKVRLVFVSSDYLKELWKHWKHIYYDYIKRIGGEKKRLNTHQYCHYSGRIFQKRMHLGR